MRRRKYRIAIVSIQGDIHSLIVRSALNEREDVTCDVIEADTICGNSGLTWSDSACTLSSSEGSRVSVGELDLIWLRRFDQPQRIPGDVTNPAHISIINNDCRAALLGILINEFRGVWISDPHATRIAGNKLVQLRAAKSAGFRVPQTIVSQDLRHVKAFCRSLDGNVVVKPVRGSPDWPLLTTWFTEEHQLEESVNLAPAIYQEYIPGNTHLRVICLGSSVYAFQIEAEELDWRRQLNGPVVATELQVSTRNQLADVLQQLGLTMGIFDLKLGSDREPVWLEVNPQGQFLFLQGMTGQDLITPMADFLYREVQKGAPH